MPEMTTRSRLPSITAAAFEPSSGQSNARVSSASDSLTVCSTAEKQSRLEIFALEGLPNERNSMAAEAASYLFPSKRKHALYITNSASSKPAQYGTDLSTSARKSDVKDTGAPSKQSEGENFFVSLPKKETSMSAAIPSVQTVMLVMCDTGSVWV